MPHNPLVSIVIPTYNRAHLIGETLDSVLAQTYTHWECIIVDDGSSDNTDEVVGEYLKKDPRFKYYHRPDTHLPGGNGARNYGFLQSKGEYIQWFDSDDLMHPLKIEIKIGEILKNRADVIIAKHSTTFKQFTASDNLNYSIMTINSDTFYRNLALGEVSVITNDVMIRKEIVGIKKFDEKLNKAQEFDFFLSLFQQKLTYVFIDISLTAYKPNVHSISKSDLIIKSVSLIYLSKKMMSKFWDDPEIVERAKRQGRKTYTSLAKAKKWKLVFKNFNFFKRVHNLSTIRFIFFMAVNFITGKGYDRIKGKLK